MTREQINAEVARDIEHAERLLEDSGCVYQTAMDESAGERRRGWWQDGVFLARTAKESLRLLYGN